jgi:DNA repair ATPase RecN
MKNIVKKFYDKYFYYETNKNILIKEIEEINNKIEKNQKHLVNIEKAVEVIKYLINIKQDKVIEVIEKYVTLSLKKLYDDSYEFKIIKRKMKNKYNIEFKIHNGEYKGFLPLKMTQGRALGEIVAIVIQILFVYFFSKMGYNKMFVVDETISGFSSVNHEKVGKLLLDLSKKLKIQIIMVSNIQAIADCSSNIINI